MTSKKILILFFICLVIILVFWVYSLKLNLQFEINRNESTQGMTFSSLKDEVLKIINKSPLSKWRELSKKFTPTLTNQKSTDQVDEFLEKLVEEMKKATTTESH